MRMRDFDDYEDAQLMQQKIAACFAAFVTKDGESVDANADSEYEQSERVEPGIIERLRPGEDVSFANPPTVTGQDTFKKSVLQAIAVGMGLSYEELTGDLSNVNFSSGRMGWLAMHRNIYEWQHRILINQLCEPVYSWFITVLAASEVISDTGVVVEWTVPKREMIDPVKEMTGLKIMIENNLASWQDVIRSLGGDPDVVFEQIMQDTERFKELPTKTPKGTNNQENA